MHATFLKSSASVWMLLSNSPFHSFVPAVPHTSCVFKQIMVTNDHAGHGFICRLSSLKAFKGVAFCRSPFLLEYVSILLSEYSRYLQHSCCQCINISLPEWKADTGWQTRLHFQSSAGCNRGAVSVSSKHILCSWNNSIMNICYRKNSCST